MTDPEIIPPEPKRPAEFKDEIFQEVCDRMAGGQGLRKICDDPGMPSRQTFLRWIEKDTGRQTRYQAAREALMDWYAEEILEIAWDSSKDTIPADGKRPARCDNEWVNRSRLKVDTLKFLMAKLHPKRYGDRAPEQEAERELKISWERSSKQAAPMARIERVIIDPHRGERATNVESAADQSPPRQITHSPTPPPADLSPRLWSAMGRISDLIEQIAPSDEAEEVPEEIFGKIESFLRQHYLS